jgi:hypothetical protein
MVYRRFAIWQFELLESALAASTTIALRSSGMMSAIAAGKQTDLREGTRMVTEKAEATSAGLLAAGLEWNRLWWRASLTGSLVPAVAWLDLIRAASRPARVTARGNARRLTRRGR